jgi:hypothetical protein
MQYRLSPRVYTFGVPRYLNILQPTAVYALCVSQLP